MNPVSKLSHRMHWVFKIGLVTLPIVTVIYWSFFEAFNEWGTNLSNTPYELMVVTQKSQFLGFLASLLPVINVMIGFYLFKNLFANYSKGQVFTLTNVKLYKNIGWTLLCLALTENVFDSLISIIMTMDRPEGVMLAFGVCSTQLSYLLAGLTVILISHVMQEAYQLEDDAKHTI